MADILIRGMRMPNCCALCDLEHWDEDSYGDEMNHRCFAYYNGYTVNVRDCGRLPGCPLVPLPEGHGRLGDLDKLDHAFTALRFNEDGSINHWDDRKNWCLHGSEIETILANAPTIVPAEGGGKDG